MKLTFLARRGRYGMAGRGLAGSAGLGRADVEFEHWKECRFVSNGSIELIAPRSFGPRVMWCGFAGGRNLFKIFPDEGPGVRVRGGHRLWIAPERKETTWVLDNDPVEFENLTGGLRIAGALEPAAGLRKTLTLRFGLRPDKVEVVHSILNRNVWAVKLAPWTLTQAAPAASRSAAFHLAENTLKPLLPTNPLVMWAYTKLGDPRWTWGERFFALRQDPEAAEPLKTGLFNEHGWTAYVLGDEVLGPLQRIAPGGRVDHVERWILLPMSIFTTSPSGALPKPSRRRSTAHSEHRRNSNEPMS